MYEIDSHDALHNEINKLEGNINRMVITHSRDELDNMRYYALLRLEAIYEYLARSL